MALITRLVRAGHETHFDASTRIADLALGSSRVLSSGRLNSGRVGKFPCESNRCKVTCEG